MPKELGNAVPDRPVLFMKAAEQPASVICRDCLESGLGQLPL